MVKQSAKSFYPLAVKSIRIHPQISPITAAVKGDSFVAGLTSVVPSKLR
jgi:hypothetical protein